MSSSLVSEAEGPLLLVTGRHFGRSGLRGIMPVMQELAAGAKREIQVLAYVMTESARPLLGMIEQALERGVHVTIVLNVIPGQPPALHSDLRRLASFGHARIRYFADSEGSQLHAKALIADREFAVLGSANYTWGGLVSNHELGVLLKGRAAWELGELADRLVAVSEAESELTG